MNLAFDTHSFYRRLQSADFTAQQAEVITDLIVDTQKDSFEFIASNLATKDDLKLEILATKNELRAEVSTVKDELKTEISTVKDELKTEISTVKDELKTEISTVKSDVLVLKWMMGFLLAGVGSLVIKAFFS